MIQSARKLLLFIIISSCLFSCAHSRNMKTDADNATDPFSALIYFYRGPLNHLSAVRQSECPMYPSCSEYAVQSIRKYGALRGWIMSCDRLLRCGRDELNVSPTILIDGKWKCYDPVEKN